MILDIYLFSYNTGSQSLLVWVLKSYGKDSHQTLVLGKNSYRVLVRASQESLA